nr:hypothetical protein [Anaerolineae bacterium]
MPSLQRQMASLSTYISEMEQRLGECAGDLAELIHVMGAFLVRYQEEILTHHNRLIKLKREIADARVQLGERQFQESGVADTPLSRLLCSAEYRSVQEQYNRVWHGRPWDRPSTDQLAMLTPASEKIKALYTEIVAKLHPYLVDTVAERRRRAALMHEVNQAYIQRNEIGLENVALAYRDRANLPTVVSEESLKKLHERALLLEWIIVRIEGQIFELRHGEVARIKALHEEAAHKNRDLLTELSADTQQELNNAQRELDRLYARLGER